MEANTFYFGNKNCLRAFEKSQILHIEHHLSKPKRNLTLFESVDIVFRDGNYIPIPKILLSPEKVIMYFKFAEVIHDEEIVASFKHVDKKFKC